MANINSLVGVLAFIYVLCIIREATSVIVETKLGEIDGIVSVSRDGREFYEWLGIPYAKPPVGSLRFAAPKPINEKWDGVLNASAYGSPCSQVDSLTSELKGTEDCLFVNVHVPKLAENHRPLPVLFYIHGGMFMTGSADQFKPHYFMDEEVLVVSFNYRIGSLGFLSTSDSVIRGNMGLKDQSLALKWVRENIASFGGDPNQITIFGQSAGSKSVHYHMLSPLSQGLMSRAISQSGTALNLFTLHDDPSGQAKDFAEKLNCPDNSSSTEMAECLRSVDISELLNVQLQTGKLPRTKYTTFAPCVETVIDDETFLSDLPINLINSGQFAKIPWLAGLVSHEGLLYMSPILNNATLREGLENDWDLLADTILFLNDTEKQHSHKIKEFYFGNETEALDLLKENGTMTNLLTDRWYSHGIYKTVFAHSKYAPVQFYYYTKPGPSIFTYLVMIKGILPPKIEILLGRLENLIHSVIHGIPPIDYGVAHGDELLQLFDEVMGLFHTPEGDPDYQFSKDLVRTWVDFASMSNVNDVEFRGNKFPSVNPNEELQVLEINDNPKVVPFPIQARIDFWESYMDLH